MTTLRLHSKEPITTSNLSLKKLLKWNTGKLPSKAQTGENKSNN